MRKCNWCWLLTAFLRVFVCVSVCLRVCVCVCMCVLAASTTNVKIKPILKLAIHEGVFFLNLFLHKNVSVDPERSPLLTGKPHTGGSYCQPLGLKRSYSRFSFAPHPTLA